MLKISRLARPGLEPVTLALEQGEAVALLGPSGSGKTLLLRAIADMDPNFGEVSLDGQSREAMPAPTWRRKVTYLAAEPGWWAERAADHFSELDETRKLLPRLGLSEAVLERTISQLSTGERHRLALILVLQLAPQVMLLDEPTSGLDQESARMVETVLENFRRQGTSLLFSSHDEALAGRLASRRLRMAAGVVRESAT